MSFTRLITALTLLVTTMSAANARAESSDPELIARHLDTVYQAAVKDNREGDLERILRDDFTMVMGDGKTYSKADVIKRAHDKTWLYQQRDTWQAKAHRFGDRTVIVTAILRARGKDSAGEKSFDYRLWYSDLYVKTEKEGWRLVFTQESLPLPNDEP